MVLLIIITILTLASSILLAVDNPDKKRKIYNFSIRFNRIAIVLIVLIIPLSIWAIIIDKTEEEKQYQLLQSTENITRQIQNFSKQSLKDYQIGLSEIYNVNEKKYNSLLSTLDGQTRILYNSFLENTDSALKSKINEFRLSVGKLEKEKEDYKKVVESYYYLENWPVSVLQENDTIWLPLGDIFNEVFPFLDGEDRFVLYYIIRKNNQIAREEIPKIQSEIIKLNPMNCHVPTSLEKLFLLKVTANRSWDSIIGLREPYKSRASLYRKLNNWKVFIDTVFKVYPPN